MKTQNIVLALALAAVTPAVLAAQENGNAYNQSTNEVIATNTQTQQASITSFGPEGKVLSLAELTLAKIRQNREERRQRREARRQEGNQSTEAQRQVSNQEPAQQRRTTNPPAYYPYGGREGHMMGLELLSNKTTQDTTPTPTYIRDIDTVSRNHQVTLDSKAADTSAKKTNSTFGEYLREVNQAIIREAPFMK